jgi:EAL domain-containing protein (putative c-di-GMP-specific phosphodiesterase class I)
MEEEIRSRRELARDLDKALTHGSLDVHYQPVVDTFTGEARCMEALARWRHPIHGFVSPAKFISIAEEAGHVVRLGEFVLERACADALAWPAAVKVAVNVSSIQIANRDFAATVRRILSTTGLSPRRLELEITESVLLAENEHNLAVLNALRDLGVSIVLDDFGTGYSSLSYLNRFSFDKIKIDKSFIDGLDVDAGASAIVLATTSIARALNAITTAEGVENESQAGLLRASAVTQMQGYFFGRPLPADEWLFVDGKARAREEEPAPASRAA